MRISSSKSRCLASALLALSICFPSVSALDITDYFTVATSGGGSCQKYMTKLGSYLQEAFDIAAAGLSAVEALENNQARFTDARHFTMMFDTDMVSFFKGKYQLSATDEANVAYIKQVYGFINPSAIKKIKPRLYCDSKMLIYTEKGYDKSTGEETDQDLQQALGDSTLPDGEKGAYWNPDTKSYTFERGASATVTPCRGTVDAFNVPSSDTIVLCPFLLDGPKKESLTPYASGQSTVNNGDKLDSYNSKPGTFVHELAHLAKPDVIDQPAYDDEYQKLSTDAYGFAALSNMAGATPQNAKLNADTYHYFAMASYLKTKDWATGAASDVLQVPASS